MEKETLLSFGSVRKWLCLQLQKQLPFASYTAIQARSLTMRDAVLSDTYRFVCYYYCLRYCHYPKSRVITVKSFALLNLAIHFLNDVKVFEFWSFF